MFPPATRQRASTSSAPRLCLVAGLFVLAALGAWRVDQLSNEVSAPRTDAASFDERRLTSLLDTVVGHGHSEVRLSLRADDSWSVLVLLDQDSDETVGDDVVQSLIGSAFAMDPVSGDEITIRRIAFAKNALDQLRTAHLVELSLILLVAGLTMGALLMVPRPRDADDQIDPARTLRRPAPVDDADPARHRVVRAVGEDPAKAASIVRHWLKTGAIDA